MLYLTRNMFKDRINSLVSYLIGYKCNVNINMALPVDQLCISEKKIDTSGLAKMIQIASQPKPLTINSINSAQQKHLRMALELVMLTIYYFNHRINYRNIS